MKVATIETSPDFSEQFLKGINGNFKIDNPYEALDSAFLKLLQDHNVDNYKFSFDDVEVYQRKHGGYPNPTLSHYALAIHLKKLNPKANKILDLGSGTGFLGSYLGKNLNLKEIIFADLYGEAIQHSLESYQINNTPLDEKSITRHDFGAKFYSDSHIVDVRIGDVRKTLSNIDAEEQIAISAPYYIPGVCEAWPEAYQVFSGIAKRIGAKIYFGHSNLSKSEVNEAAEKNNMNIKTSIIKNLPFSWEYFSPVLNPKQANELDPILEEQQTKDVKKAPQYLIDRGLSKKPNGNYYHSLMVSELSA